MRHALLTVLIAFLVAPLCALSACGGGGGAGSGDPEGARATLIEVLDAARMDDFAKARNHLDIVEWLASVDNPKGATYLTLPKAEQEEIAKGCFRGVADVVRVTKMPDHAAIDALVRSGTIENMPQLKAAKIHFNAPDAEREGRMLGVDAKLRYGIDGVWRLAAIAADY